MQEILIKCNISDRVNYSSIVPTQGNLKSLSKESFSKLKKSILKEGFFVPIFVWENDGQLKCLDGHQRLYTLKEMEHEGYEIPLIPIVRIYADSLKEAADKLLQLISQYGKIEGQGLYEFMIDKEIDMGSLAADFELPNLNIPSFGAEYFHDLVTGSSNKKEAIGSKEYAEDEFSVFQHNCPRCGFGFD